MHRLVVAAVTALVLLAATPLVGRRAEAMPLPGAQGLGAAGQSGLVQEARYVCRTVWNGWRWVEQCYWVAPRRYYRPSPYRHDRRHDRRHHRRHR